MISTILSIGCDELFLCFFKRTMKLYTIANYSIRLFDGYRVKKYNTYATNLSKIKSTYLIIDGK